MRRCVVLQTVKSLIPLIPMIPKKLPLELGGEENIRKHFFFTQLIPTLIPQTEVIPKKLPLDSNVDSTTTPLYSPMSTTSSISILCTTTFVAL